MILVMLTSEKLFKVTKCHHTALGYTVFSLHPKLMVHKLIIWLDT